MRQQTGLHILVGCTKSAPLAKAEGNRDRRTQVADSLSLPILPLLAHRTQPREANHQVTILRDYQETFLDGIRVAFNAGHRGVIGVKPTGAGKTKCFCEITRSAVALGNRVFILVHRQELIKQTSRALSEAGVAHGIIAPGYPTLDLPVQVCSVYTLARRLDKFVPPDLLIIDECHHSNSSTWLKVINWLRPDSVILGVTATPQRLDGRGFSEYYSHMVLGPTVRELIDLGWLCRPVLYAPPTPDLDLSTVHTRGGDYAKEELELEVDKPSITGSAVEHYRRLLPHSPPTVVFCVSVDHARNVAAEFRSNGIPAASIDGSMSDAEREDILSQFEDGRICVLASCSLVDEGFDLPKIGAVIDLAPTQSLSRFIQRNGRGLRPFPGKTECIILDHVQNWKRHGLVHDDRDWSLEGKKKKSKKDPSLNIATCQKCYWVGDPIAICPRCGAQMRHAMADSRQIEEREGELVLIDEAVARAALRREEQRTRSIEGLIELGRSRGYKNPEGWAEHKHKARIAKLPIRKLEKQA